MSDPIDNDYPDLDPRVQRDATDLLAEAHEAWQAGRWGDVDGLATILVRLLTGTQAWEPAVRYRAKVRAITYARAAGPVDTDTSVALADEMLTAWMHLRAALLP